MLAKNTTINPDLADALRSCHDESTPPLGVRQAGDDVEVVRHDGSELSASERTKAEGVFATHGVALK